MASTYELIVKAVDKTSGPLSKIERNLKGVNRETRNANGNMRNFGGGGRGFSTLATKANLAAVGVTAVAAAIGLAGKASLDAGVKFTNYRNRLTLITKDTADLNATMSRLGKLAVKNRTAFGDTIDLYTNLKLATEDLGFSTGKVEQLTSKLSQSLQVSGADAATTSSVIRQFGQAMASGTVRGDEFNSLVEGLGPALSIMARESGISVGQLREMSKAGELTAEKMAELLLNSNSLTESFNGMAQTIPQLKTQMDDAFTKMLADISDLLGLEEKASAFMKGLARTAQEVSRALTGEEFLDASQLKADIAEVEARVAGMKKTFADMSFVMRLSSGRDIGIAITAAEAKLRDLQKRFSVVKFFEDENFIMSQDVISEVTKQNIARIQKALDDEDIVMGIEVAPKGTYSDYAASLLAFAKRGVRDVQKIMDNEDIVMSQFVAAPGVSSILAASLERKRQEVSKYMAAEDLVMSLPVVLDIKLRPEQVRRSIQYQLVDGIMMSGEEIVMSAPVMIEATRIAVEVAERQRIQRMLDAEDLQFTMPVTINPEIYIGRTKLQQAAQSLTGRLSDEDLLMGQPVGNVPVDGSAESKTFLAGLGIRQGIADRESNRKPPELTTSQELVKTYKDQNTKLTELQGALSNVATLSKEAGVSQEFLTEKIREQMEALDVYKDKALTVSEIMKEGFQEAVKSLSSELANALVKGENVFDALKNSFNNMLQNILTQILQSQISSALAGLFGGAGGGGGGFGGLGGMLTSFLGTPTVGAPLGGLNIPFLANGGVAQAGQPHIVGEKGPELFMPASTGRVVANDELNTGGGGAVVNFNINAIDTQSGTQFLLENKQKIIGMVSQGFNQRGRQGITS